MPETLCSLPLEKPYSGLQSFWDEQTALWFARHHIDKTVSSERHHPPYLSKTATT